MLFAKVVSDDVRWTLGAAKTGPALTDYMFLIAGRLTGDHEKP